MPLLLLSFSAFCFVMTMAMHIAARLGAIPSNDILTGFLLVCFPVMFAAFYFHPDRPRDEPMWLFPWRTLWGYPHWLKLALVALLAYDMWFGFAHDVPHRWSIGAAPLSPLLAQASALVLAWLYAFSAALFYDMHRRPATAPV
jgi:hypothetical protein